MIVLLRPWLLALLVLVPLYAWLAVRRARAGRVPYAPLQYRRPGRASRLLARLALPLELATVALVVVALAGPATEREVELIEDEGIDIVLVLDVSLSMLADDFPPDRLTALRRIAGELVTRSAGNRLGVVVFAGDPFVQTPLSSDHAVLRELLDAVTVYTLDQGDSGGTALGDALLVGAERLVASRVEGRDQALVVLTDGESNTGIDPVLAARWVAEQEIRLHAIGIGGTEPVPVYFEGEPVGRGPSPYLAYLDDEELRAVAEAAGGSYRRATDVALLEEIFADLSRLESAPLERRALVRRHSLAPPVAAAALGLAGLHLLVAGGAARRPWR